jgi:hypothetical protein
MTTRRTTEPHDRLTRLCAAMTDTLDAHPEMGDDVQCMVFLQDGESGGLQLHGYDDDTQAIIDLVMHLRAIFRSNGKELILAPISGEG